MSEPWVRFEDNHLLVVHKPSGVNTHRADVHAQDGMHEWVQRQRPGVSLAILHRLDKATSGVLVFGKTGDANRSLASQFESRSIEKRYELLVRSDQRRPGSMRSEDPIAMDGRGLQAASTDFELDGSGRTHQRYVARPHSGRTHQVRIHAGALGMPIVGDSEHGGDVAARMFLHAASIGLVHPDGADRAFDVDRPASFDRVLDIGDGGSAACRAEVALEARSALFDPADTNAYVWIDRAHDGFADTRVERLGAVALAVHFGDRGSLPTDWIQALAETPGVRSVYTQHRPRGGGSPPALRVGDACPRFEVVEAGLRYLVDLDASATSTGIFLDQRETRRELATGDLAGKTVLNTFAHTGSLSVAAAAGGAETLTLDLSKHYLDWARENLHLNDIDAQDHDFIYGDALEWMGRLAKKGRTFDIVLVDPPSSSTARKEGKRWSVGRDLDDLVAKAARLCAPGGQVYVSTNFRKMTPGAFVAKLEHGLAAAGRAGTIDWRTLPLDHRSGPGDPPYLKAAWLTLD